MIIRATNPQTGETRDAYTEDRSDAEMQQWIESQKSAGYYVQTIHPKTASDIYEPWMLTPEGQLKPEYQQQGPTKSVSVLGSQPSAQDIASMAAKGYVYGGQQNGQQVWKPGNLAPGTYTAPGGGTYSVTNQGISYEGKPYITREGQKQTSQTSISMPPQYTNAQVEQAWYKDTSGKWRNSILENQNQQSIQQKSATQNFIESVPFVGTPLSNALFGQINYPSALRNEREAITGAVVRNIPSLGTGVVGFGGDVLKDIATGGKSTVSKAKYVQGIAQSPFIIPEATWGFGTAVAGDVLTGGKGGYTVKAIKGTAEYAIGNPETFAGQMTGGFFIGAFSEDIIPKISKAVKGTKNEVVSVFERTTYPENIKYTYKPVKTESTTFNIMPDEATIITRAGEGETSWFSGKATSYNVKVAKTGGVSFEGFNFGEVGDFASAKDIIFKPAGETSFADALSIAKKVKKGDVGIARKVTGEFGDDFIGIGGKKTSVKIKGANIEPEMGIFTGEISEPITLIEKPGDLKTTLTRGKIKTKTPSETIFETFETTTQELKKVKKTMTEPGDIYINTNAETPPEINFNVGRETTRGKRVSVPKTGNNANVFNFEESDIFGSINARKGKLNVEITKIRTRELPGESFDFRPDITAIQREAATRRGYMTSEARARFSKGNFLVKDTGLDLQMQIPKLKEAPLDFGKDLKALFNTKEPIVKTGTRLIKKEVIPGFQPTSLTIERAVLKPVAEPFELPGLAYADAPIPTNPLFIEFAKIYDYDASLKAKRLGNYDDNYIKIPKGKAGSKSGEEFEIIPGVKVGEKSGIGNFFLPGIKGGQGNRNPTKSREDIFSGIRQPQDNPQGNQFKPGEDIITPTGIDIGLDLGLGLGLRTETPTIQITKQKFWQEPPPFINHKYKYKEPPTPEWNWRYQETRKKKLKDEIGLRFDKRAEKYTPNLAGMFMGGKFPKGQKVFSGLEIRPIKEEMPFKIQKSKPMKMSFGGKKKIKKFKLF